MSSQPIKAVSKEFSKEAFYLLQTNKKDRRYVVSLRDKIRIRTLLAGFINQAAAGLQIKIRDFSEPENPKDYFGKSTKTALHELMTKHEAVIFHHGFHDLMIRKVDSGDYIVFDEHGLIFIYTDQDYTDVLSKLGAAYKPKQKLIYELNHWHYSLSEGSQSLAEMIQDFKLKRE